MAKDKALVGAAGVHYVAFQLSSLGYAVGLTAPGVKAVDMVVANPRTGKSIAIQVKTMTDGHVNHKQWPYWKWRVSQQLVDLARASPSSDLMLALVASRGGQPNTPDVFIVPVGKLDGEPTPINPLSVEVDTYPKGSTSPNEFWCCIYDTQEADYKNNWEIVKAVLGPP